MYPVKDLIVEQYLKFSEEIRDQLDPDNTMEFKKTCKNLLNSIPQMRKELFSEVSLISQAFVGQIKFLDKKVLHQLVLHDGIFPDWTALKAAVKISDAAQSSFDWMEKNKLTNELTAVLTLNYLRENEFIRENEKQYDVGSLEEAGGDLYGESIDQELHGSGEDK